MTMKLKAKTEPTAVDYPIMSMGLWVSRVRQKGFAEGTKDTFTAPFRAFANTAKAPFKKRDLTGVEPTFAIGLFIENLKAGKPLMAISHFFLVHFSAAINTLKEFMAWVKRKPSPLASFPEHRPILVSFHSLEFFFKDKSE